MIRIILSIEGGVVIVQNCRKEKFSTKYLFHGYFSSRVAESAKPGQFVIVIADEQGERVPLTICDYDKEKGTVTIVVQSMGCSTKKWLYTMRESILKIL